MIAVAVAAAGAVVLSPLLATGSMRDDERFLAIVALAGLVYPLAGVARLLPWAIALLAGSALVASEHGDVGNFGVALCAALVLLVAECAATAGHLAPLARIERRLVRRLVVRMVVETAAAGALAAVVLASASLGIASGLTTLTLGLVATVLLFGVVAGLVVGRPQQTPLQTDAQSARRSERTEQTGHRR